MQPINEIEGKAIKDFAEMPFGEFVKLARKLDPLWGYKGNNKFFKVGVQEVVETRKTVEGYVIVEAPSKEMAEEMIGKFRNMDDLKDEFKVSEEREDEDTDHAYLSITSVKSIKP